jgi:hypothetical protein
MKKLMIMLFLAFTLGSQAQTSNYSGKLKLFKEVTLDMPQYKNHIGEVCFSNDEFERTLPESKYIKTYKLGDKLSMRAWTAHSPANSMMIQLEESGISAKDINSEKNDFKEKSTVYFVLYLDGKLINHTNGSQQHFPVDEMTQLPTHRSELNDGTKEFFYDENLYEKLLERKDLLQAGTHKLKIEFFPSINTNGIGHNFKYKPLAVGEIDLIVPETKATEENCFPYKVMSDKALEDEVLKKMKEKKPNAFKVILNSSVSINRNEYGVIISKSFKATVVSKTNDRVWYDTYVFEKLFDGAGYMGVTINNEKSFLEKGDWTVNKDCLKFLK